MRLATNILATLHHTSDFWLIEHMEKDKKNMMKPTKWQSDLAVNNALLIFIYGFLMKVCTFRVKGV
jgi:hypothetical protein